MIYTYVCVYVCIYTHTYTHTCVCVCVLYVYILPPPFSATSVAYRSTWAKGQIGVVAEVGATAIAAQLMAVPDP